MFGATFRKKFTGVRKPFVRHIQLISATRIALSLLISVGDHPMRVFGDDCVPI